MKRLSISSIQRMDLTIREPDKNGNEIERDAYYHNQLVIADRKDNRAVALVDRDNLYDNSGNRFQF